MNHVVLRLASAVSLWLVCSTVAFSAPTQASFGPFGKVTIYTPPGPIDNVVLFISGDSGWNTAVVGMAETLAQENALVAGIDLVAYRHRIQQGKQKCLYPAADFERLSKFLQRHAHIKQYHRPVLAGYSAGASLVYALIAQAPPGTFRGGISMSFCPDMTLSKPLCHGHGLVSAPGAKKGELLLKPNSDIPVPWHILHGGDDQVCNVSDAIRFTAGIKDAKFVHLPKVGHGFSVTRHWQPQMQDAFRAITAIVSKNMPVAPPLEIQNVNVDDLNLIEVGTGKSDNNTLAVILSGDGGWASIDKSMAEALQAKGLAVVGFDSLDYFWTQRTPDETAKDVQRVIRHYLASWKKSNVILIGYSFGADILPFVAHRLDADIAAKTQLTVLLGPSLSASFEFHLTDWATDDSDDTHPLLPEVSAMRDRKVLCIYGSDEDDSFCKVAPAFVQKTEIPGGHHFGGDYDGLADIILRQIK